MSEYHQIQSLFYDMTVQLRQLNSNSLKLYEYQQQIESSNINLERMILSLSASKDILSFENPKQEINNTSIPMQEETTKPVDSQQSQISKMNNSTISLSQKGGSQKRPRETIFSLEKQKGNVPKKFQNAKDLSVLERILQYIASKKKEGVLLKDIYVLINESTIKCNDYLNVLIKLEEIVRTQTKKGFVYSLHPIRYNKYLNS